ncbi:MAG TPA: hypothetical protein VI653_14155 [Steroidobacteraceae bacterium]
MSAAQPCRVFEVDISIQNNTLIVGVNGGNVTAAPGDKIVWRAGHGVTAFTLQFFQLGAEPPVDTERVRVPVATLRPWPFTSEVPPGGIGKSNDKGQFEGTLMGPNNPAKGFKYSVVVGNLQLDPVVIVDR